MAKNPSKLVDEIPSLGDEIPFRKRFCYDWADGVAPELAIPVLNRLTHLNCMIINKPIQDIERFLNLLKKLDNIVELKFNSFDQPQELFDRLPDHCAVQNLFISKAVQDLAFVIKLKKLIYLELGQSIDAGLIQKIFEELTLLSSFDFLCADRPVFIEHRHKRFGVSVGLENEQKSDLNAAANG